MNESQLTLTIVLSLGMLAIGAALVWGVVRKRRRATQFSEPFPPEWRALLERKDR